MTSREQFEAWFTDKYEATPASMKIMPTKVGIAWEAWQAASKASEQQLAALAANNALLKGALLEEGYRYFDADTEVTDVYLAEVRAQGVEMLKEHVNKWMLDMDFPSDMQFEHAEFIQACDAFAAQLRQGAEHE